MPTDPAPAVLAVDPATSLALRDLARRTRASLDRDRASGARYERVWSPATWELLEEMADRAGELAPGWPRRMAEMAVSAWMLLGDPLEACVAKELELRLHELPVPQRGAQGFSGRPG